MTMTHAESLHPHPPRVESVPPVESRVELVFRELVTQHKERLYRVVLKHIGHSTEAEDLAQQAFVEAARTFETFRGESQLSTWLYGIAMNLVRNHLSRAPQRLYRMSVGRNSEGSMSSWSRQASPAAVKTASTNSSTVWLSPVAMT